jgi:hypothetical protein
MKPFFIYIGFWLVLMLLGIANGILREKTYGRHIDELKAHQLSTLTAIIVMSTAVWVLASFVQPPSLPLSALIGLIWLSLTVAFEFGFGHFVAGHSWQRLLHDYNLFEGRVWTLLLLWILFLPLLVSVI